MIGSTPASGRTALIARALAPVDISGLVYFRIAFGLVVVGWVVKYWTTGLIDAFYIAPNFHFSYYSFEWIEPLPGGAVYGHFVLLGACGLLIAAGCFYGIASLLFALAFTYLFLIDKSLYQNHYYMILLLSWIMVVVPVDRAWSIDALWRRNFRSTTAPAWSLWLLRFQVGLPYFFGGIAKLNSDWLQGEPMRSILAERTWYPGIGQFFTEDWCVWLFAYGGLLFDLLVVPALLWRPTRPIAFGLSVVFHLLNATLFQIGVFPWMMIVATAIFFPPDWPRRVMAKRRARTALPSSPESALAADSLGERLPQSLLQRISLRHYALAAGLSLYAAIQLVVPLRHYFVEGNPSWTEQGHYFAWHMMLRGKQCGIRYYATAPDRGRTVIVDLRQYLTPFQAARFGRDPRMVHQLARKIAEDLRNLGVNNPEVRVLALVSLNGRKPQMMIDPAVDLAAEPITWSRPEWILPLTEPLRETAWNVPLLEWERHVDVPHWMLSLGKSS